MCPRTGNGDGTYSAIIGDPRNDENVMVAGLHCAHILFYNRVLSELDSINLSPYPAAQGADLSNIYDLFRVARQITLWHYQWLLVNEHLPQIAGQAMVSDVLTNGNRFYKPRTGNAFMPIEFAATYSASSPGACPRPSRSRRPWASRLSNPATGRHQGRYLGFGSSTPRWYYILAEARTYTGGRSLGWIAGRMVAETLIGLLRADPTSYLSARPGGTPFLGSDLQLRPNLNPNITGSQSHTPGRTSYAQVVTRAPTAS
jgi:hypothetical protein